MLNKLKNINHKEVLSIIRFALVIIPALLARPFYKDIWLISERKDQARDNGYCFYKYLCKNHKSVKAYYIINKHAKDYDKIKDMGQAIQFDSWRHFFFYCVSRIHISSHVGACFPSNSPICKYLKPILRYKDVFLPHGVSYGISEFCLAKYAKIDLFITSGKYEYENVLANYGYSINQVAYTGFPRLDEWHHLTVNPKQIILMPTWRVYLAQDPNVLFEQTDYYKAYRDLIMNEQLSSFLVSNGLKMIFYLHHEMRKYVDSFDTDCPNIDIAYNDDRYDIQELLKESALLITDYSSVHFDFAYMGKPVLYYQFDRKEFWEKQYKQSDFDAATDGFGPVAYTQEQLIENLKHAYVEGFCLQEIYEQRMKEFYVLRDENNCERVYKEISKLDR